MRLWRYSSLVLATLTLLGLTAATAAGEGQAEIQRPAAISNEPASSSRSSSANQQRTPRSGPNLRLGGIADWKWWQDGEVRRALELSDDKVALLERLFQKRIADLKPYYELLRHEREKLDRMTRERTAGEAEYTAQVSRVWDVYSWTEESRIVMLYAMARELRPEQYATLLEIFKQRSGSQATRPTSPSR